MTPDLASHWSSVSTRASEYIGSEAVAALSRGLQDGQDGHTAQNCSRRRAGSTVGRPHMEQRRLKGRQDRLAPAWCMDQVIGVERPVSIGGASDSVDF